jgi:hypothetical protein
MIANDAPEGQYGTAKRFKQASLATGYHFKVLDVVSDRDSTLILVTNTGVAPIYKKAVFSIEETTSTDQLGQLMPGDTLLTKVNASMLTGKSLDILSMQLPDAFGIEYEADIEP